METIVISMGGSLIVPDSINVGFLKNFKSLIDDYIFRDFRFVIVCGGGKVCRDYQRALSEIIGADSEAEDWLGVSVTHVNAQLVKSLFKEVHPEVICDPNGEIDFKEKVLVAGGWKPGFSTDMDAVLLAKNLGVRRIINLTNVDYVYDKDPKAHDGTKKYESLSWKDFGALNGDSWSPGLNKPFDPVASKEAEAAGLAVIIAGKNLDNLRNIIEGKEFKGTTLH